MWTKAIFVFVGGGLGATVREYCMLLFGQDSSMFPLDIFMANIIASFVLGLVFGSHRSRTVSDEFSLLIATGFTGGMSTFSSFVFGAYSEMVDPAKLMVSLLYIIASLVVGFAAAWAGVKLSSRPGNASVGSTSEVK